MKNWSLSHQLIFVVSVHSTLLLYFFLGVKYWSWHLSWIIFIIFPIATIIKRKLLSFKIMYPISLFISIFLFNLLAFNYDLLSVAWLVLIVESMILLTFSSNENIMNIFSLPSLYMMLLIYIGVNILNPIWYSSLAVLFVIPWMITYSNNNYWKNKINVILYFILPSIFLFLEITYQTTLSFIILPLIFLGTFLQGYLFVKIDFKRKNDRLITLYATLICILFSILSIVFDLWLYSGILFLTVPVIILIAKGYKDKITLYIGWLFSAIIFFACLLGYALEVYSVSWYYIIIMFILSIITPCKISEGKKVNRYDVRCMEEARRGSA